jgi:hypothetical protein
MNKSKRTNWINTLINKVSTDELRDIILKNPDLLQDLDDEFLSFALDLLTEQEVEILAEKVLTELLISIQAEEQLHSALQGYRVGSNDN